MKTITTRTICDRTLVFRMMIAMTTFAMLGCRRAAAANRISGRSFVAAFVPRSTTRNTRSKSRTTSTTKPTIRLLSSRQGDYDDSGRRIRTPRSSPSGGGGGFDDNDDWGPPSNSRGSERTSSSSNNDSWDDFDPWDNSRQQQPERRRRDDYSNNDDGDDWGAPRDRRPSTGRRQSYNDYGDDFNNDDSWDSAPRRDRPRRDQRDGGRRGGRGGRGRGGGGRGRGGRGRGGGGRTSNRGDDSSPSSRSINMNGLEGAGYVHLYGLSSVLNALATGRRDMVTSNEKSDMMNDSRFDDLDDKQQQGGWDNDDDDDDRFGAPRRSPRKEIPVKPEAQFRPYLFVQERNRSSGSDRRGSKASAAQEVMKLAEERGVPIAHVDKGVLNVLSGNRPHQGFALRCGKLFFETLSRIPLPSNARGGGDSTTLSSPSLWLVLDEVVDPQNLGT
uniref:RNA 2-O ribose methyltransferase substrate binding domain-containing protein n=1 Tax=Pseudo-nitzschia australis TaxID=44445 RepID=A0A7S4ACU7_9STRA